MKEYPSIENRIRDIVRDKQIYAFDKLDGSQIRSEWDRKKMFWKFGTRHQMLDEQNDTYGEAVTLIKEKYEKELHDIFKKNKFMKTICFFEFYGKNSFAGRQANEKHTVTLFDISIHKKGILEPINFLKMVGHLDIPKMLYMGNANKLFIESVLTRELDNMSFEGVVCKGQYITPGVPLMFKIKSREWLEKLKYFCHDDELMFEKLK